MSWTTLHCFITITFIYLGSSLEDVGSTIIKYENYTVKFTNLAVYGNNVYIGSDNGYFHLDLDLQKQSHHISRYNGEQYQRSLLLTVSPSGRLIVCSYITKNQLKTYCTTYNGTVGFVNATSPFTALKVNDKAVKHLITSIQDKETLLLGSSSCLHFEVEKCYAVQIFNFDDNKFNQFQFLSSKKYHLRYKSNEHVHFLAVLKRNDFIYFLLSRKGMSKLGKMCTTVGTKNSYEDTPITCSDGNKTYTKAIDGIIWNDHLFVAFFNEERSIICRYKFRSSDDSSGDTIESTFMESRKMALKCPIQQNQESVFCCEGESTQCENYEWCYNTIENVCQKPEFDDNSCTEITNQTSEFCGNLLFESVEGNLPINSSKVVLTINADDGKISKLGVSEFPTYSVMYVGTSEGSFEKVFINATDVRVIGDRTIIQGTIPVLDIQSFKSDVLVMTENKVVRIREPCDTTATSCEKCMESNSPVCGWDVREKSCTNLTKNHWFLPSVGKECLKIMSSAYRVPEQESEEIKFLFTLQPLVTLENSDDLFCKVDSRSTSHNVSMDPNGHFSCSINITKGSNVSIQLGGNIIASKIVETYRCSEQESCSSCLQRPDCHWCKKSFGCSHKTVNCNHANNSVKDTEKCPTIIKTELPIPEGQKESVFVGTRNFENVDTQNLKCQIGNMKKTKEYEVAVHNTSGLVCMDVKIQDDDLPVLRIKNKFNSERFVDGYVNLTVYNCQKDYDSCSSCTYRQSQGYKCKWNSGKPHGKCEKTSSPETSLSSCGSVTDINIYPDRGPLKGGTAVTITGKNLGYDRNSIRPKIGGVNCSNVTFVDEEKFDEITCVTGAHTSPGSYNVTVTVNNKSSSQTTGFNYVNVTSDQFGKITPNKGIKSGGRKIKIFGTDYGFSGSNYDFKLCTNNSYTVCVGCRIEKGNKAFNKKSKSNQNRDHVMCSLESSNDALHLTHMKMVIDGHTILEIGINFTVIDNPELVDIPKIPSVFKSGGFFLPLKGKRLQHVDRRMMAGRNCTISPNQNSDDNDDKIKCPIPKFENSLRRRKRSTTGQPQNVNMQFDDYKFKLQLSYVDDPEVFKADDLEYSGEGTVTIKGTKLLQGATKEMYEIDIGMTGKCYIEAMYDTNITCSPPPSKPRTNHSNENYALIVVRVGSYYQSVGYLIYVEKLNLLVIIAGSVVAVLVITVVSIGAYVVRIKKKNKMAEKEFEMKLSSIEQRIRETSREEFADAQMTIKDIKSDLVTSKVPYHDYQTFVFNHLFPNQDIATHPMLHQPMVTDDNRKNVEQAMDMFGKLLTNKMFLRVLVRTLDSNVNPLTMKDKAQFSSLLSVVFAGNMRLFYQLISCLLEDMIKQANKKQHKVLFRRFESITQRLTVNWLVMSLYDHIKTNGGMQLFMLYKATQTVVEKGPIDAVNLSCKYTLAEERLLKTRVDCETMKLAIDLNGNGDTTIPVEVLDCDTISQVKHKCCSAIYKNKPASEIPKTEDLELEWHAGKGGKLTLQDVDNISERSNGMLRLNTLKHYLVKDGSVMALMYKDTTDEPDDMYVNQVIYMRQLMENYGQGQPGSPASPDHIKLLIPSENHSDMHKWHLSNLTDEEKSNTEHEIGEIFLNRLFHTKLVLKEYIDVAFEGVVDPQSLSEPVRYFLCMLDKQGKDVGVDSDVLQNWKSECYATRVWASMIAKPQLLFDVDVPTHVEPCMDILKQVFIDSFTQIPQNVTKEASTQKLLFCKDIPIYRKLVNSFFMKVEPVNDQQFWRVLDDISNNQTQELKFSRQAILHQLYKFIFRYREKILDAFEDDEECKNLDFARKLENVTELMEEA